METFSELKELSKNPHFQVQRQQYLCDLTDDMIDMPIVNLIKNFNNLPYCFTLQSCYGHFVYKGQKNIRNLEPLPATDTITKVEYRIAYIAYCIDNSTSGRQLLESLNKFTSIDPQNLQSGCAEWFWEKQVNSYVLQVEPDRFKHKDKVTLDYKEALYIEKLRNKFFIGLLKLLESQ